jgi:uncharacterized protein YnzC (UPF0291/DUF896 family)
MKLLRSIENQNPSPPTSSRKANNTVTERPAEYEIPIDAAVYDYNGKTNATLTFSITKFTVKNAEQLRQEIWKKFKQNIKAVVKKEMVKDQLGADIVDLKIDAHDLSFEKCSRHFILKDKKAKTAQILLAQITDDDIFNWYSSAAGLFDGRFLLKIFPYGSDITRDEEKRLKPSIREKLC